MKADWVEGTLGSTCLIKPPKSVARSKVVADALVSFAPMEDLGIDRKYMTATKSRVHADVVGSYTYFADGDVLLAKITPCFENGKLGIASSLVSGIGYGSSEYIVFRPGLELSNEWLYYWLSREDFREEGAARMSGAVGHKRVSKEFIENYPIPLPPLAEQLRIVAILDKAFDGIAIAKANAEKSQKKATLLFQAALSRAMTGGVTEAWRKEESVDDTSASRDLKDILTLIGEKRNKASRSEKTVGHELLVNELPLAWELTTVDSLFKFLDYRGKNPSRSEEGRRLITARNIKMGFLSDMPETFLSEETYKKWMVRGFPKFGDILFVTEGHTMGFVALNTRTDDFALAQRVITLQPIVSFETKFFFFLMMSVHFQELVKLNATGSAAVGIKGSKFRSLPLPFPSFQEQQVIGSTLDDLLLKTQRLESIYQQKLAALDELKKSLLHQAFSGAL